MAGDHPLGRGDRIVPLLSEIGESDGEVGDRVGVNDIAEVDDGDPLAGGSTSEQ